MGSDWGISRRLVYAGMLAATVLLGLASRRWPELQPEFVAAYAGDAFWAAMVYWIGAFVWPALSRTRLAAAALGVAMLVEVSQLYRAPWIDAVRASRVGALVLGRGFLWSDLVCYAAGVAGAVAVDVLLVRGVREAKS
jgi:hypothetical protein